MTLKRRAVAVAMTVSTVLVLAGCETTSTGVVSTSSTGSSSAGSAPVQQGTQTGEGSYLSSTAAQVVFVRFTDNGSGGVLSGLMDIVNADANSTTGTDTTENSFTGTRNGPDVTLSIPLDGTMTGTLQNGTLSLNIPQSSGQLATETFQSATVNDYNAAVAALQNAGYAQADTNAQAAAQQQQAEAAAQAAAAKQAQDTKDQQAVQSDLSALQQDANFSADVAQLWNAVSGADSDLAKTRSDAKQGQGDDCYNVSNGVGYDAVNNVEYDAQNNVGYDLQNNLGPNIATARQDIKTLQSDAAQLNTDGLPVPSTVAQAINAARSAISKAASTANGDIDRTNADVIAAYAVANGMATGSCVGDGPGNPPQGLAHLS
ncbi:MAG TPA: hypothetical protein VHV82_13240 [Sporichthyaceae bacterium]|jgi:hypothetical protein|nr:hypothetical protein [Sporichthyaceae bacterium]